MKRFLLTIICAICAMQMSYSQEDDGVVSLALPVRNSLTFNRYAINPTFSFVREQNKFISITNKREWVQFDDAPETYSAGFYGRFAENIGAGVGLFQQNYGVLTTFGGVLNFAYNARLNQDSNLTFGLNLGVYQSGINTGKVITNFSDPSLEHVPSHLLLTVNPGINYGTEFLDFGASINNLVLYNVQASELLQDDPRQSLQAHIMYTGYIHSGGFFDEAKFSGLVRSEFGNDDTTISGMAMLTVPKGIWAQVGYNTLYGASAGLGLNITKQIAVEYNFEKALGDFTHFGPSHEISLAFKLHNNKNYTYSDEDEMAGLFDSDNKRVMASSKPRMDAETRAQLLAESTSKKEEAKEKAKEKAETRAQRASEAKAIERQKAEAAIAAENKKKQAEQERAIAEKAQEDALAKSKADALAATEAQAQREKEAQEELEAQNKAKAEAERVANAKRAAEAQRLAAQEKAKAREAKAKQIAEAQALLIAEEEATAEREEEARRAAAAEATAAAEKKAKADAEAYAKAQATLAAMAKVKADAEAKEKQEAQKQADLKAAAQEKLAAEEAKARADAEAAEQLAAAKAQKEVEAQLALEAQALADAEKAAQQAKAAEAARAEAKAHQEAERLAQVEAENAAQTKDEVEQGAEVNPTDAIGVSMKTLADLTASSKDTQDELLAKLNDMVAVKDQDLKDLKEENDLSEQGIFSAPKAFKSITEENNALRALHGDLDKIIDTNTERIKELESLYKERSQIPTLQNDEVILYYQKAIKTLKAEQATAIANRAELMANLKSINEATEFERKRRIKRAAFTNQEDRYEQDRAALGMIKRSTPRSPVALKSEDFDFGEEQGNNIQIIKNVSNTESGYYVVVAVHNDAAKRDEFLRKAVAAGETNIDFFYDVTTSRYFIYYKKLDSIDAARDAMDTKGDQPYNKKMSIIKIEN